MANASSSTGEVKHLRELIELLTRKMETIEKRLRKMKNYTIPQVTVEYVGGWPKPQAVELNDDDAAPFPSLTVPNTDGLAPLLPFPGHACLSLRGSNPRTIGLSTLGLDGSKLESVVTLFAQRQRLTRAFVPIFVTDSLRFEIFRRQGFVFEYIPRAGDYYGRPRGKQTWEGYVQARLELIKKKWGLGEIANLGSQGGDIEATAAVSATIEQPAAPSDASEIGIKIVEEKPVRQEPRRRRSLKKSARSGAKPRPIARKR